MKCNCQECRYNLQSEEVVIYLANGKPMLTRLTRAIEIFEPKQQKEKE